MGIVRDSRKDSLGGDRTIGDRDRHKEKVREYLKEGIHEAIAEESIIGRSGKKIIKVPIRGIKEYRFVYGSNRSGVGEGSGDEQAGQVIPGDGAPQGQGEGEGGNQPGEDVYETEITLDEAIALVFEDLELPNLEQKKLRNIEVETQSKPRGYRKRGSQANLSRRQTLLRKKKREIAARGSRPSLITSETYEALSEDERHLYIIREDGLYRFRIPIQKDDRRYKRRKTDTQQQSNAVVFCIMDTSGSMGIEKKFLSRCFFFLLYNFVRTKYQNVEVVFIAHHTEAKEVTEEEFFHKGESGGTMISSGYAKMIEIIEDRYSPEEWNIYGFHCSDGDNYSSDNKKTFEFAQKICTYANLFGYGEIKPKRDRDLMWGGITYFGSSLLEDFESQVQKYVDNFATVKIEEKSDIWPAFKSFLNYEQKKKEKE